MNRLHFIRDKKLLIRQALTGWLLLLLAVFIFTFVALILSTTISSSEIVVGWAFAAVIPFLISGHVFLKWKDYYIRKPSTSLKSNEISLKDVKLFVSYASEDKSFVREFMGYMSKGLQSHWIDEEKMLVGDRLKQKIEEAIEKETNYFIVFISKSSLNSPWQEDELHWKIQAEVESGKTVILPVLLDDVWKELASKWNPEDANYLTNKLYVKYLDRSKDSVKMAAKRLSLDIEDLLKRESN